MNNRDIWFILIPHLSLPDLVSLSKVNTILRHRFLSENFWIDFTSIHTGNRDTKITRGEILKIELGKCTPMVKCAKILLMKRICIIPGIEKYVPDLEIISKLAGEISPVSVIEYYLKKKCYKGLAYGLCKAKRFVLLEKLGLSSRPENTFAILSGLSSVGELERIKTTLKSVALSGESPIEPLIESLPHYDTFVYLFTEYVNNNAVTDEVTQLFTDAFLHEYFEVCEFLYTKYHSNLITDALLIGIKSEKQLTYYCQKLDGMICFYNLIVHDKITSELSKKLNAPLIRDLLELGLSKDNPLILKYFLDHNMIKLEDISLDSISGTQCIQFLAKKQHSNIIPNLDRISSIVGISGSMNIIRNYAKISKEIRVLIKKYPEVNTLKLLYDQMKATEW